MPSGDPDPRCTGELVQAASGSVPVHPGTISLLVAGLSAADLAAGDGRVRRLAQIAARHADAHRAGIETALAAHGVRRG